MADVPPCRTLYLRSLPQKLPAQTLRALLHALASPHGAVTWISAAKTVSLRGQAFITFADVASATAALAEMNGAPFVGSTIVASYARSVSDRALAPEAKGGAKRARREKAKENAPAPRDEKEMDVELAPAPAPTEPNRILFAENLAEETTAASAGVLGDLFGRFGGFSEVRTVPGRKDIAFVEFASEGESAVALSGLQGHAVGGKNMVLSYAKK